MQNVGPTWVLRVVVDITQGDNLLGRIFQMNCTGYGQAITIGH